jgi:hypothetical protein
MRLRLSDSSLAPERIVAGNGARYRADALTRAMLGARHQRISPHTPRHNGKVERANRIPDEEFPLRGTRGHQSKSAQLPSAYGTSATATTGLTADHRRHQPHRLIHLAGGQIHAVNAPSVDSGRLPCRVVIRSRERSGGSSSTACVAGWRLSTRRKPPGSSDGLAPTTIAGLGNVRKRPWVIRLV